MDHSLAGGVTLLHFTFTSHQRRPLTRFGIYKIVHRLITMIELKEVLRLWREGLPKKRLAAQLGLDPKTVRFEKRRVGKQDRMTVHAGLGRRNARERRRFDRGV